MNWDSLPKEALVGAITVVVPIVFWIIKLLAEALFSMLSKSLTTAFQGVTDRLDRLEELVRDLIKSQGESIARHDMNSAEIDRVRDRVHTLENVVTVLKTSCELCSLRVEKELSERSD